MHPPRCPYRGNASALRASRGVHNKGNQSNFKCLEAMMEYVVREAVKLASSTAGVSQLSQYKKSQDKSGLTGMGSFLVDRC